MSFPVNLGVVSGVPIHTQRVHVLLYDIYFGLKMLYFGTLGPKYVIYGYVDPPEYLNVSEWGCSLGYVFEVAGSENRTRSGCYPGDPKSPK